MDANLMGRLWSATDSIEDRFWSKVDKTDDCWLWIGSKTDNGYGQLRFNNRGLRAHRVSYELVHGPIPHDLEIDHLCSNPSCVNPDHLEAVTHKENMRRSRSPTGDNARSTHCKRGHAFTPENTRVYRGHRICRTCRRERERWIRRAV